MMILFFGLAIIGCKEQKSLTQNNVATDRGAGDSTKNILGYTFIASYSKFNYTYLEYDDSKEIITLKIIKNVDPITADIITSDRIALFKSIFEPKRVDYPGQYTRTIECPEAYKPKYYELNNTNTTTGSITDGKIRYFIGFANANKVAGACSTDLIYYHYAYGFMHCPSQQSLIEIEYYSVLESNKTPSFMKNLTCTQIIP